MNPFLVIILPATILVITFGLQPLRNWLETLAQGGASRNELVETFQTNVARFLRSTDPEKHSHLRRMIVWTGEEMMRGTRLVDSVVAARRAPANDSNEVDEEFDSLSDEAIHALAQSLGTAFCLSASNAIIGRDRYASLVRGVATEAGEVREPKQVVHRYPKAASLLPQAHEPVHAFG